MIIFRQKPGELLRESPVGALLLSFAYSGAGDGKNNPLMQHVHNVGPIPAGAYWIGEPRDTAEHGPFVLPLTPVTGTQTFGRSAFLIHGDSIQHPGTASHGCIIAPRQVREQIARGEEKILVVLSGLDAVRLA